MKQPYEKPEAETVAVEQASFFCTNPPQDPQNNPNGLDDYSGEPW